MTRNELVEKISKETCLMHEYQRRLRTAIKDEEIQKLIDYIKKQRRVLSALKDEQELLSRLERMHNLFETHKKYCRLTNIIWAALCVFIYIWF